VNLRGCEARCCLYVGLTDHPERGREERGSPADWQTYGPFHSEAAAQRWERMMESLPGYTGTGQGSGWRFGFTYSAHPRQARPVRVG